MRDPEDPARRPWCGTTPVKVDVAREDQHRVRVLHGVEFDLLPGQDPAGAYAVLRPGRHNAIRSLGLSFFTKFLYFAGCGDSAHPCLIFDRVVATALRDHCGWESLHRTGPWPGLTYQRYCDLLARWAGEIDRAPDEIERTLFAGRAEDPS